MKLVTLVALINLSGCSALTGLATSALGAGGLSAEANVGQAKAEGEDSTSQQANTAVAVDTGTEATYQAPVGTIVNKGGLRWWELGLVVLLAGWAIPSPAEMIRGAINVFRR